MADLLERITDILSWTTLGPAAFADEIGVPRPVISHVLTGRNKASLEVVQKILGRYKEISPIWLLSGEGKMLTVEADQTVPPVRKNIPVNKEEVGVGQTEVGLQKDGSPRAEQGLPLQVSSNSQNEKTLVKVILLYSDGSFSSYDPFK